MLFNRNTGNNHSINFNYINQKIKILEMKPTEYIVNCINGHPLNKYVTKGGKCNYCKKILFSGNIVMDCRKCNYWICLKCVNNIDKNNNNNKDLKDFINDN